MDTLDNPLLSFYSEAFGFGAKPVELKDVGQNVKTVNLDSKVTGGETGVAIDCNFWLPLCASVYQISPKIQDYVMVPCPSLISDIPNTNGDCITKKELLRFDPQYGMPAFKTFKGKPTFLEHNNQDVSQAKGVILDVFLRPLKRFGNGKYAKVIKLLAFDRTKDPVLVSKILSGEANTYSMGMYYKNYNCSICNSEISQGQPMCGHTQPRRPTYKDDKGRLTYRNCNIINGFECSSVGVPAFTSAISDVILAEFK